MTNFRHGGVGTRTYRIWGAMKRRCANANTRDYPYYGGRGIKVCPRWVDSFSNFLSDMGECPAGLTIERRSNAGNYEPGNCLWETRKSQSRNQRSNRLIESDGVVRPLSEWAEIVGFKYQVIQDRLNRGWPVQKALTHPLRVW